jgi:hypothetical protein
LSSILVSANENNTLEFITPKISSEQSNLISILTKTYSGIYEIKKIGTNELNLVLWVEHYKDGELIETLDFPNLEIEIKNDDIYRYLSFSLDRNITGSLN